MSMTIDFTDADVCRIRLSSSRAATDWWSRQGHSCLPRELSGQFFGMACDWQQHAGADAGASALAIVQQHTDGPTRVVLISSIENMR